MNWDSFSSKIIPESQDKKHFKSVQAQDGTWTEDRVSKNKNIRTGTNMRSPHSTRDSAMSSASENGSGDPTSTAYKCPKKETLGPNDDTVQATYFDGFWPSKKLKSMESFAYPPLTSVEIPLNSSLPPLMLPQAPSYSHPHEILTTIDREDPKFSYPRQFPSMQLHNFSSLYSPWYGLRFPPMVLPPPSPPSSQLHPRSVSENLYLKKPLMRGALTSPTRPASNNSSEATAEDAAEAKRKRNNEAAKKSRDARREKEDRIAVKTVILQLENKRLREEYEMVREEFQRKRSFLDSLHLG